MIELLEATLKTDYEQEAPSKDFNRVIELLKQHVQAHEATAAADQLQSGDVASESFLFLAQCAPAIAATLAVVKFMFGGADNHRTITRKPVGHCALFLCKPW